ncbi:MAG: hypothetical protein ACI3XR_08690, partial [Eubacteriales bacterium]
INLMDKYFGAYHDELSVRTGYIWPDSVAGIVDETPDCLFDRDLNTKWCCGSADVESCSAVVWSMSEPVTVTHYSFTTANDNEIYLNRNPVAWRLYGSNSELTEDLKMNDDLFDSGEVPEGWVLLDQVFDSDLPDANYTECAFSVDNPTPYQHYMLLIDYCDIGCTTFQLSELTLYGIAPVFDSHAEGADAVAQLVGDSINLMDAYYDRLLPHTIAGGFDWTVDVVFDEYEQEKPNCLFDRNLNTKWRENRSVVESCSSVVWSMTEQVIVTHYSFTTANDNEIHPNRNPVAWRLYGTNLEMTDEMAMNDDLFDSGKVPEGWDLLDQVFDSDLPDANFTECAFSVDDPTPYQHYMLLIDYCDLEGASFQLSELTLYGIAPVFDNHAEGADAVAQLVGDSINLMDAYYDRLLPHTIAGGFDWTVDVVFDEYEQEKPNCLFDRNLNTKWRENRSVVESCSSVVWSMTEQVIVTHYSFTTANDNEIHPNRNPVAWRLYGTNLEMTDEMAMNDDLFDSGKVPEGWDLLDQVFDSDLPDANFTECAFSVDDPTPYQHYMLLIDYCDLEGMTFQLSELTLYGRTD